MGFFCWHELAPVDSVVVLGADFGGLGVFRGRGREFGSGREDGLLATLLRALFIHLL